MLGCAVVNMTRALSSVYHTRKSAQDVGRVPRRSFRPYAGAGGPVPLLLLSHSRPGAEGVKWQFNEHLSNTRHVSGLWAKPCVGSKERPESRSCRLQPAGQPCPVPCSPGATLGSRAESSAVPD